MPYAGPNRNRNAAINYIPIAFIYCAVANEPNRDETMITARKFGAGSAAGFAPALALTFESAQIDSDALWALAPCRRERTESHPVRRRRSNRPGNSQAKGPQGKPKLWK
jgi:hypothetical protein